MFRSGLWTRLPPFRPIEPSLVLSGVSKWDHIWVRSCASLVRGFLSINCDVQVGKWININPTVNQVTNCRQLHSRKSACPCHIRLRSELRNQKSFVSPFFLPVSPSLGATRAYLDIWTILWETDLPGIVMIRFPVAQTHLTSEIWKHRLRAGFCLPFRHPRIFCPTLNTRRSFDRSIVFSHIITAIDP